MYIILSVYMTFLPLSAQDDEVQVIKDIQTVIHKSFILSVAVAKIMAFLLKTKEIIAFL